MRYGWNLDSASWGRLKQMVDAREWKRVYLEELYISQVPSSPGVYLICARAQDVPLSGKVMELLYNAIYVGQSKNMRTRFRNHLAGYRNVQVAKLTFRRLHFWFTELNIQDLDNVEQLLLETLGPSANAINVKAKVGQPVPAG